MRSYLRYREHVADVACVHVLGSYTDVLRRVGVEAEGSMLTRCVGTHPSRSRRLRVIVRPSLLTTVNPLAYFALGLGYAYFAIAVHSFIVVGVAGGGLPPLAYLVTEALVYILVAVLLARVLFEQYVLSGGLGVKGVALRVAAMVGGSAFARYIDPFVPFSLLTWTWSRTLLLGGIACGVGLAVGFACAVSVRVFRKKKNPAASARFVVAAPLLMGLVLFSNFTAGPM
jgi:hypothetical protein